MIEPEQRFFLSLSLLHPRTLSFLSPPCWLETSPAKTHPRRRSCVEGRHVCACIVISLIDGRKEKERRRKERDRGRERERKTIERTTARFALSSPRRCLFFLPARERESEENGFASKPSPCIGSQDCFLYPVQGARIRMQQQCPERGEEQDFRRGAETVVFFQPRSARDRRKRKKKSSRRRRRSSSSRERARPRALSFAEMRRLGVPDVDAQPPRLAMAFVKGI